MLGLSRLSGDFDGSGSSDWKEKKVLVSVYLEVLRALIAARMVSGHLFHCRKSSWPAEEYVSRATLQLVSLFCGSLNSLRNYSF